MPHTNSFDNRTLAGRLLLGTLMASLPIAPALAGENLAIERGVAKVIIIDNEALALREAGTPPPQPGRLPQPGEPEAPQAVVGSHNVAILPQIGYDPSLGAILGVKYSNIDFGASNMNLDIGATQSTKGQTAFDLTWSAPHLFESDFIGLVHLNYELTPTQDFFGLGNNELGSDPDPLSTHEFHEESVLFTLARRLAPHWVAAATLGYDNVSVGRGKLDDQPATVERFPDLPGIDGGSNNPVSLSILYNTQRDVTRPAHGWNVLGKVQHVGPELGNDFEYTRYIVDASYVHPIMSPAHVIGVRVAGEYVDGAGNDLPFFEFASIGGADNLRGFFPNRFLGQSRVFAQVGYRTLLADFNFYNIWRVRLDGAVFGGAGRVFLDKSKLPDALRSDPDVMPSLSNDLRYSYGVGLRIALSEALVARLDAGFSKESKGLIYLVFGNTF